MASFYDLPKEVVEEIMSRVPAISVLRFKCVNKYWHALISALINDQIFVSKHLDYAKNNCHASLIFSDECPHVDHRWIDCDESCKLSLITMVNDSEIDNIRVALEFLKLPLIQSETGYMWQGILDIRQCDGIILLVKDKQTLVLCNPILHEFKILPASKYDVIDSFVELASPFGVGFGYDHRANVYKTIRVFYDHDNTTERAEVYTLGTDSWREIDISEERIHFKYRFFALHRRGVCYWVASNDDTRNRKILCFHMCDEEFYTIPFPNNNVTLLERVQLYWVGLEVWNDSLALFFCSSGDDHNLKEVEVFVLEDQGSCSWTKRLNVGPLRGIAFLLSSWSSTDELLMVGKDGRLVSYNLGTQKLRDVTAHGGEIIRRAHFVLPFLYVKSLVSVRER